jgi:spore coat polysaccharide biosynthesis protein SpsF
MEDFSRIDSSVTAIIQARMQSKRLPGKSMKEIGGKPLLSYVIERAKAMNGVGTVVVATCPGNEDIVALADSLGVFSFVGSESNVLERYALCAGRFGGEYIVRITGDNPFTDVEYGGMAIEIAVETKADLTSVSGLPLGVGVEVIKRAALETAYAESTTSYQFEHVTPYLKEHSEMFTIQRHPIRLRNPFRELRLTVDTPEDYDLASRIFQALGTEKIFSVREIIALMEEFPELASLNRGIEQRPMTHSEK